MLPHALDSAAQAQAQARIVATAQDLFLERGIALVSLAEVALALRLPVATIERAFPLGKPALLTAAIDRYLTSFRERLAEHQPHSSSAVEEMLRVRRTLQSLPDEMRGPFLPELAASYPAHYQYLITTRLASIISYMQANLHRGIAEGFYRANLEVAAETERWVNQSTVAVAASPNTQVLAEALAAQTTDFLARVTSPAGALVARRLQEAAPYY
ncbi:TetR/AcrR family transcriptional regulator [Hymenobacter nivis]|uniref:TetR/AcrR family transcriptional regulator n=1 Tax=Hymenobacter nivis TaxID=1850093 RepID=A0A502GEH5_9BACT|nr:TetR/AcrR family transcriptional regulator [Hymenobacter nivis]TPG59446.1 TetR/AcrR family transcriptional regulator [Hymenobacter nivis]